METVLIPTGVLSICAPRRKNTLRVARPEALRRAWMTWRQVSNLPKSWQVGNLPPRTSRPSKTQGVPPTRKTRRDRSPEEKKPRRSESWIHSSAVENQMKLADFLHRFAQSRPFFV